MAPNYVYLVFPLNVYYFYILPYIPFKNTLKIFSEFEI